MEVQKYTPEGKCRWSFNWVPSSPRRLRDVEQKILSFVKTPFRSFFVDIDSTIGEGDKIWTLGLNTDSKEVPLVMLHGLGAGIALWVLNLDGLAAKRPVYAMDVLGFGRSTRPCFSTDPLKCEQQFVLSVEEWRRKMNFDKMILLGHSLGGFIASSYALSYPDRIQHLILADPWGFAEKPAEFYTTAPRWVRFVVTVVSPFNPLAALRAAGPFGHWWLQKARADIMRKYSAAADISTVTEYIQQSNLQKPSGETGFHTMMDSFAWAKNPMHDRIKDLRAGIPITFIYGKTSWLDSTAGEIVQKQRSLVDVKYIDDADHHLYADQPEIFNQYVNEICDLYMLTKTAYTEPEPELTPPRETEAQ